jgi:ubiquinone biosynthesis protein
MDLIKTGIGISRTIKNVARMREILTVLSKNGFNQFIIKSGLNQVIPSFSLSSKKEVDLGYQIGTEDWWKLFGERLRVCCEELGPSFIKFGQLLSTREDLFDPLMIKELKKLQNNVKTIPFEESLKIIENSLGQPHENIFQGIEKEPIGTASIGVVYKAKLISGEEVVIKVRRPHIEKLIKTDFEILMFIIGQFEKVSEDLRYLGLTRVLLDFSKTTLMELNFLIEATNAERLSKNLSVIDQEKLFVIPKVYRSLSSSEVLILEYLDGKPFNQFKNLDEMGPNAKEKLEKSVIFFVHTLLSDGFFHADLHGGNFFVLKDGKIGLLDFGLMGTLSQKNRTNLIAILYALITRNFDNLVYEFLDVADYEQIPNHDELIRDLKDALSPYLGLSVQETNVTDLVRSIVQTLARHRLYLPREWFIIFRALMTLDGVGKSVGFDLNIFKILEQEIPKLVSEILSKEHAKTELMWVAKDLVTSMRIVPKHIKWFLKEISKKNYAFEFSIKNFESSFKNLSGSISFLSHSMIVAVLIFCGASFIPRSQMGIIAKIPTITWIFWSVGVLLFLGAKLGLRRINKN